MTTSLTAAAWRAQAGRSRPSKYHARRTIVDGVTFDSAKEAREYTRLKLGERAGVVRGLERQPVFVLHAPTGAVVGKYVADFRYTDAAGAPVVVDVKGFRTPLYLWKRRHVEAEYGIRIEER
jgi:hypothetical protein